MYSACFQSLAARTLPDLLAEEPNDAELREVVALLCVSRVHEVRAFVYSALGRLWQQMPEFAWGCPAIGVGQVLRFRLVRKGGAQEDSAVWLDAKLHALVNGDEILDVKSPVGQES
jgi:hypothetical protein